MAEASESDDGEPKEGEPEADGGAKRSELGVDVTGVDAAMTFDLFAEVERQLARADPPPMPAAPLNPREEADVDRKRSDTKLSKVVAGIALGIMAIQIIAADGAFYMYGNGNDWHIPVAAIEAWLAATVIQVVSIVLVIARSLFPGKTSD